MKKNYVLIDFESVQPESLGSLAHDHFRVVVFVGANQVKLPTEIAMSLQRLGPQAEYIQITGNGPNALDFHIAWRGGRARRRVDRAVAGQDRRRPRRDGAGRCVMLSPVRTRRSTVLADARPGGRLPPLDLEQIRAIDLRREPPVRVGAAASDDSGGAWRFWLPLALVPVGGLVGCGAATLLGLRACSRMAIALGGGLALGATGAAAISLMNKGGTSS